jgi:hypothetical protein
MEAGENDSQKPTKAVDLESKGTERVGEPRMSFEIFYCSHGNGDSLRKLKGPFEKCDIYIPEAVGWTDITLNNLETVASGIIPTESLQSFRAEQNFLYQEYIIIHNSHKPVVIVDIPAEHPLIEKYIKLMSGFEAIFNKETFEETLGAIANHYTEGAGIQREREKYMLSQLRPKVLEAASISPQLKDKKEIKVLMLLGNSHEWIFDEMTSEGYLVNKIFSSESQDIFQIEAFKKIASGERISQDLASKIFLEHEAELAFSSYMRGITDSSEDKLFFYKIIASQFTFDEAREIFNGIKKGEYVKSIFERKLKEKGIKLPQSPAQLREFMSKE